MNALRTALQEYLGLRRALGFRLRVAGGLLHRFVSFAEQEGAWFITTDLALRWATQVNSHPSQWANRLSMVRRFAQYRSATDPRTEVPPSGLLPHRYRRKPPYLYKDEEISRLIQAAGQLPSPRGLRASTYSTLFGLLAVTGMRMSEPLALDRQDVDLKQGVLNVRQTNFGKSRWVPLHPSTQPALEKYAHLRDKVCPSPKASNFHGALGDQCVVRSAADDGFGDRLYGRDPIRADNSFEDLARLTLRQT